MMAHIWILILHKAYSDPFFSEREVLAKFHRIQYDLRGLNVRTRLADLDSIKSSRNMLVVHTIIHTTIPWRLRGDGEGGKSCLDALSKQDLLSSFCTPIKQWMFGSWFPMSWWIGVAYGSWRILLIKTPWGRISFVEFHAVNVRSDWSVSTTFITAGSEHLGKENCEGPQEILLSFFGRWICRSNKTNKNKCHDSFHDCSSCIH